jgi:hypothetical protein
MGSKTRSAVPAVRVVASVHVRQCDRAIFPRLMRFFASSAMRASTS